MKLQSDSVATIDYVLTDDDGTLIEASPKDHPLVLLMGRGALFPALEEAMIGLEVGEELDARLPPNEAYGFHSPELVQRVPKERFNGALEVGLQFEARSSTGRRVVAKVLEIDETEVLIDANHPLAGKTLRVRLHLLDLRLATPAELEQGRIDS
jgi:FKBP-type peptidyl-prolyl cis-trans isomerase SlyD